VTGLSITRAATGTIAWTFDTRFRVSHEELSGWLGSRNRLPRATFIVRHRMTQPLVRHVDRHLGRIQEGPTLDASR
jgi:inorganic triphosphatase YgiF